MEMESLFRLAGRLHGIGILDSSDASDLSVFL